MYRLLIADDEALEREGLEWIVRRAMPDAFQMIFAENGRRALELAEEHRPHIIFMDIHMPGIQGLDALRQIRDRMPDTKLVLVTAYDYFAYAQEAIAIGVKEYIVKPASREQITSLLQKLVQELDNEKQARSERLQLIDRLFELEPIMENELALMFMVDQVIGAEAEQLAEWIRFPLEGGFAVVAAWPELPPESKDRRALFEEVRAFAKSLGQCLVSSIIDRHMALFFPTPKESTASAPNAGTIGQRLAQWTADRLGQPASIGVGVQHAGVEGLRRSYVEAVFASSCCGSGGGLCLFAELQRSGPGGSAAPAAMNSSGGMNADLAEGSAVSADEATNAYVMSALRRSREMREHQTISALDRARRYIESRFTEELSLEEVADHVHLNSFYLSKVFKQYVGETFIDYLTSLRIKRAKQLIEDDALSLKEICFEVGYKDPNYFSRVFKKVTGVTPSDYRASGSKGSDS
ncbi:AraC family transcriptional regulator [Paenibacillus cellulosilyticus]|uniref:AraC family transcriptional regulator n=1 Tax=Paenibacillus cellulosilyticus TaxID=375489 RepID=UPI0015812222|nr:AraC family transcriptional regulator [Paenibacillus cellulosilyticus]QKS46376.1 AraC family transcriptional regulator [Paenibacillus cellulosilyticus]